jgi:microsomal dipeptidase-like Zn-dependent dipeptidase
MMLDLSQLADGASDDTLLIWRGPLPALHSNDRAGGLEDVARHVEHLGGTAGGAEHGDLGAAWTGAGRPSGRRHRLRDGKVRG